jgi:hypothetical protein
MNVISISVRAMQRRSDTGLGISPLRLANAVSLNAVCFFPIQAPIH